MLPQNQNYAKEKGFDNDNHLTNEVKKSLANDGRIDQKEAQFMSKIIDKYRRQNIKIEKKVIVQLAREFGLNYKNFSKIGPRLESLIKERAKIIKNTEKSILDEIGPNGTIIIVREKVKKTLENGFLGIPKKYINKNNIFTKEVKPKRLDEILKTDKTFSIIHNGKTNNVESNGKTYVYEGTNTRVKIYPGDKLGEYVEIKSIDYYKDLFKNYKGNINGPKTLKTACKKLGVNIKSLQRSLEIKEDGIIGGETYGNFKGEIIDGFKYSYSDDHNRIRQTQKQKEIALKDADEIGKLMGRWLENYGPKNKPKGACGQGVYKIINKFFKTLGINRAMLLNHGRDGGNWGDILENPKNFDSMIAIEKIPVDFPKNAPIGSIVYYKSGIEYAGSPAKKDSGHVEIVGHNKFYYDGAANNAGGSAWRIAQSGNPEKYAEKTGFSGYAYRLTLNPDIIPA